MIGTTQNAWLCSLLPEWAWMDGCSVCAGTPTREDDKEYEATRIIPEGHTPATAMRTGEYLVGTGIDLNEAV